MFSFKIKTWRKGFIGKTQNGMDRIISVQLPEYLLDELEGCAREFATTRSQIIRSSIRKYCRENVRKIQEPPMIFRVE